MQGSAVVQRTHRHDGPDKKHPANRLGLDYRQPPAPRAPEMQYWTYIRAPSRARRIFEAAALYGVDA